MSLTVVNRLADHHWCAAAATATMLTAAHMVPAAGANIVGTMASAAASSAVLRPRFTLQPRLISAPEIRSEEHTSELHSQSNLGCRLLLEKKLHRDPPRFKPATGHESYRGDVFLLL